MKYQQKSFTVPVSENISQKNWDRMFPGSAELRKKKERARELESEIKRHRELYYNRSPEISDAEFDALVDELRPLAPGSTVLKEVETPR